MFLYLGSASAGALDNVEQVIMKCRVNSVSTEAQVTCLEDALRARLPSAETPNWSGITEDGRMPETSDRAISGSSGQTYPGQVSGIGSEQVQANQPYDRTQRTPTLTERSTVVDFAYNANSRLILVLSNGQVWKQRDGDIRQVRLKKGDRPEVIVSEGRISGYRMTFPDLDRVITVTRLQ